MLNKLFSIFSISLIGFAALPNSASAQIFGPGFMPPPPMFMPPPIIMPPPPIFMPPPPPMPVYQGPMQSSPPIPPGPAVVYNTLGMNREAQVAAECARQYGVSKAAAGCIVARLTADEINKCFTDGIGGRGCFGDNNTLVSWARNNFAAAQRETNAVDQAIRFGTGVSVRDINERGILGGDNSDARKICNGILGAIGGSC